MIDLQLSVLAPLPDPVILEANGHILDPANASNGATLVIGASANLREGEIVTARWKGPKSNESQEKLISATDAGKAFALVFSNSVVVANDGQNVVVTYSVTRASGTVQESARLDLKIMSAALVLPAPTVDSVGPDGVLRPSLIAGPDAVVRVSYRAMEQQDLVRVRWVGEQTFETNVTPVGDLSELVFGVPKAVIEADTGGTATLTYIVTRNGTDMASEPLELSIIEGMVFDTSPVTLAGKVYLVPGYPGLLPAAFPSGTTVLRPASGGRPPYTYSSSDLKVAVVDASGLTSVRGNGVATITVIDAAGEKQSYDVSVTGVIECHGAARDQFRHLLHARLSRDTRRFQRFEVVVGGRHPMHVRQVRDARLLRFTGRVKRVAEAEQGVGLHVIGDQAGHASAHGFATDCQMPVNTRTHSGVYLTPAVQQPGLWVGRPFASVDPALRHADIMGHGSGGRGNGGQQRCSYCPCRRAMYSATARVQLPASKRSQDAQERQAENRFSYLRKWLIAASRAGRGNFTPSAAKCRSGRFQAFPPRSIASKLCPHSGPATASHRPGNKIVHGTAALLQTNSTALFSPAGLYPIPPTHARDPARPVFSLSDHSARYALR
nr:hypothetical protein [Tanacetum cinerariifolium]